MTSTEAIILALAISNAVFMVLFFLALRLVSKLQKEINNHFNVIKGIMKD